jgi:hypothetical protein
VLLNPTSAAGSPPSERCGSAEGSVKSRMAAFVARGDKNLADQNKTRGHQRGISATGDPRFRRDANCAGHRRGCQGVTQGSPVFIRAATFQRRPVYLADRGSFAVALRLMQGLR